jgi:two-component system LytT family response regulator
MPLSKPVNVLIVDDQPAIRKYVQTLVTKEAGFKIVGSCGSVNEACLLIALNEPDLLLLDISLPDGTGFDILAKFPDLSLKVIFLTAYHEHAVRAFRFGAIDYLLKPIVDTEFKEAIDKALQSLPIAKDQFTLAHNGFKNGVHTRLVLRSQSGMQIVEVKDIIYCKSDSGYTQFYLTGEKTILTSKYIKEYEDILPAKKFMRPHQSYIVNIDFIDSYHKEGYLLLKNKAKIPVAVRRKEDVIDYIKNIH